MGDLAGLIAPKTLKIVAYTQDDKVPYEGTLKAYDRINKIYAESGCAEKVQLITVEGERKLDAEFLVSLLEK
jgi:hypothetical protein